MSGLISSCGLAYESEYPRAMREIILPYNSARRNDGYFDGEGGSRLFLSTYKADSPVGAVTMVHGYTESAEKWQELIYSLLIHGFSVYAYDARGHGRSGRDSRLGGDLTLTHVDSFEDYVSDSLLRKAMCIRTISKSMRCGCCCLPSSRILPTALHSAYLSCRL